MRTFRIPFDRRLSGFGLEFEWELLGNPKSVWSNCNKAREDSVSIEDHWGTMSRQERFKPGGYTAAGAQA